MSDENINERSPDQFSKDQIKKTKETIANTKAMIKDLKTNPKYKEFFARYHPDSVDYFIKQYVTHKQHIISMGPYRKADEQKEAKRYVNDAKLYFPMIQVEKLMRLQFEWNEGNMELEGIVLNADLNHHYFDIFNCPFITKITKQDVDDLAEYLISDEFKFYDYKDQQDYSFMFGYYVDKFEDVYDDYNDQYESYGMPMYHYFLMKKYNLKPLHKDSLLRARKEAVYLELEIEERRIQYRAAEIEHKKYMATRESRPNLYYHNQESTRKFITTFEEPMMLQYHDTLERFNRHIDNYETEKAISYLEDTKAQVTVRGNDNWQTAIIEAAESKKREKIIPALYLIYENYLQNKKPSTYSIVDKKELQIADNYLRGDRGRILRGRELSGEPLDFNF